jgi:hypothetical protein
VTKYILVFTTLVVFTLGARAEVLDLGDVTRDASTGLDWLDVTVTQGLSYNQVAARLGPGGDFEGWRFATADELGELIVNFGYVDRPISCSFGVQHCDINLIGDRTSIERIIKTLGDTRDAVLDEVKHEYDTAADGAAELQGLLNEYIPNPADTSFSSVAAVRDREYVNRQTREPAIDENDAVKIHDYGISRTFPHEQIGSFLVRATPAMTEVDVPIPWISWFFLGSLLYLVVLLQGRCQRVGPIGSGPGKWD